MSWSVSAIGKAGPVAAKVAADLAAVKCSEPEETIKNTIGNVIAIALKEFPPDFPVRVRASGSQYSPSGTPSTPQINQLSVTLEPIYGFVE